MAMKFVAPVIAPVFAPVIALAPRLANPLKKKACCLGGKTRASLYLQKRNRRPVLSNA